MVGARAGFTLIELAVVLVVIGLIVGAVLTGQSLIRASEVQSIVTDLNKITTAIQTFRGKYNALPGDMPNATGLWGTASGGCPTGTGSGTQTCNGNGDGIIAGASGVNTLTWYESFRIWQHLGNAQLIPGTYTGVTGPGGQLNSVIGSNVPASRVSGVGYSLIYGGGYSTSPWFVSYYGHLIFVGAQTTAWETDGAAFTEAEALALDTKIDDGLPGAGRLMQFDSTAGCSTTTNPATATYDLSKRGKVCIVIYKTGI